MAVDAFGLDINVVRLQLDGAGGEPLLAGDLPILTGADFQVDVESGAVAYWGPRRR